METIQLPTHVNETAQELYDLCADKNMLEGFVDTLVMEEKVVARKPTESSAQIRKKRKRCGLCAPCMRKEACGKCYNCVNRRTSHQICKLRKCEQLKKKSGAINEIETGLECRIADGNKIDHMEGGTVNHVERRLKPEIVPNFINRSCEEMGSKMLLDAKQWTSRQSINPHANEKMNWGDLPVLSQAVVPNNANLEDARNLVAFSAVAEAMSSYGMSVALSQTQLSTHLYEKFNYEMSRDGAGVATLPVASKLENVEDLNAFKTALSLAKHGEKPPNCNCDGPECPDYLEWLEKKIQSAICEEPSAAHPLSQVNNPPAGKGDLLEQVPAIENILTQCSSNPPPFCQSALSIAKEKNISLQQAIAIEALTQLSSALPQPSGDVSSTQNGRLQSIPLPSQHHMVYQPPTDGAKSHILPMCNNDLFANDISHPYIDRKFLQMSHAQMLTSWEQVKKTDQELSQYIPNHNHLNSPIMFAIPTPIKKEFTEDWSAEVKNKNSLWDLGTDQCPLQGDPMTGLKQLLGDANDFIKSEFKRPELFSSKVKLVKPKEEQSAQTLNSDSSTDIYKMTADQQLSQLLQENVFHKETLPPRQVNLHHKRHLFQEENHTQPSLTEQHNWWIPKPENSAQNETETSVNERKKQVQSPSESQAEPKPKSQKKLVQIKKAKLRDTNSLCLPMLQIQVEGIQKIQKADNSEEIEIDQYLSENGLQHPRSSTVLPMSQPPQSVLQKRLESSNVSGTQEIDTLQEMSVGESQHFVGVNSRVSNYNPCLLTNPLNGSSNQDEMLHKELNANSLPIQNEINSVDVKFEELIREFEAEYGEDFSLVNSAIPSPKHAYTSSLSDHPKSMNTSGLFSQTPFVNSRSSSVNSAECTQATVSGPHLISQRYFTSKSPKQVKIESSGALTVLSTNYFYPDESQDPFFDGTPTKNEPFIPSLSGFLESPLKYLDSPTKSLLDTPCKKAQAEFPTCDCVDQIVEKDEGPYYTHLGSGPTVASIRELMEGRYGERGKAIRIEKVIYTGKEGKSSHGCPIAKWVIRRQNEEEKLLCLVRHRAGHHCENAVIIILIMAWEGIPRSLGDALYEELTNTITKYGNPTTRRCGLNDDRTCACQGIDPNTCGASFSFGCSWSMYFNGCKYARSKAPRKFRLGGENHKEEEGLRDSFQDLATKVAPVYKMLAPQAYQNQVASEDLAIDCRLGQKEGRPFAGVTACMDFCAHAHKDQHNLYNGCTVVCTLTKEDNRTTGEIPDDEQLHVLPLYKISTTDEFGSEENQAAKMKNGAIQVLSAFPREVRRLSEPAKSCRQRQLEAKKAAAERRKILKEKLISPDKLKQETFSMPILKQNPGAQMKDALSQQPLPLKPAIKMEPQNPYNNYKYNGNAVVESYSVLGNCRPSDPYSMNSVYSYHSYYAQPNLPSMNGFHSKFSLPSFGYYGFPSNHMFPQQYLNYGNTDPRNGAWLSCNMEKRPNSRPLQDNFNHSYRNTDFSEQALALPNDTSHQPFFQGPKQHKNKTMPLSHRTTPDQLENPFAQNRNCFSRTIKQEPADFLSHTGSLQRATGNTHNSGMVLPGVSMSSHNADQEHLWESYKLRKNGSLPAKSSTSGSWNLSMNESDKLPNVNLQDKLHPFNIYPHAARLPTPYIQENEWNLAANSAPIHDNVNLMGNAWSSCKLSDGSFVLADSALPRQEKAWPSVQRTLNSAIKSNSAFQDHPWNSVNMNERQAVTPGLGLHEKVWNSFTASAMDSDMCSEKQVHSLKTEINSGIRIDNRDRNWHPSGMDENHEGFPNKNAKDEYEEEVWSDSEHNFLDENIGGVAVAPGHGSILIECARRELHATTPLKKPNRSHPSRVSLVFYQHKNLNQPTHGQGVWEAKMRQLEEKAKARQEEAARLGLQEDIKSFCKKRKWGGALITESQTNEKKDTPTRQALSVPTNSAVTVSSYAYSKVTGPYSRWI
ncbi:methylcytosine dioxygenase TET3 isoform X2 [Ambystoma mexicanum]|uniref:methylcytosine dioxygenase TET3 isoform X2 n=1 Tax=Ambystoma mexicanum TaxID=8296 RepID=UPI0037E84576